jgi:GNAT superfamily N-acetyltransferase
MSPLPPRTATAVDLDSVTGLLHAAFLEDPLWRWAFPEPAGLEVWWRFYIRSALRYPHVWIAGDRAAASVWIPPGGTEVTEEEEAQIPELLESLLGDRAQVVLELLERFEVSHPRERPHYYLSLLGTHPSQRGRGLGMALLADNLARIDEEGMPAYLESSNPANDARYAALGFVRVGSFTTPDEAHSVSTMWREP